jgi:hypothetical protein
MNDLTTTMIVNDILSIPPPFYQEYFYKIVFGAIAEKTPYFPSIKNKKTNLFLTLKAYQNIFIIKKNFELRIT